MNQNCHRNMDLQCRTVSISYKSQISVRIKMEQNYTFEAMNQFLNQVEQLPNLDFLSHFEENYHLKEFKLTHMTPALAAEIYHDIFQKFMKNYSPRTQLHWGQNELRLFMWTLACHLEIVHHPIQQLNHHDWESFCSLLPNKQPILFQYQALSLYKEPVPAKKWAQEEDDLFLTLIQSKEGKYKWSELAKQLYIGSNRQYFRTPKQCRQRWLNHLDPNKSKDEWELKEDFTLISHVITKGKKWAQISKLLKNRRNQHSIKNRFKSLITREQKQHPSIHEQKALIEIIYKKYDNHFTKLRLMNVINSQHSQQSEIKNQQIPTQSNINHKQILSKETFHILKNKDDCKIQNNQQPSLLSIDNNLQYPHQKKNKDDGFLNIIKEAREKQIRADIFLCQDPFEELKKFFKSKDSLNFE